MSVRVAASTGLPDRRHRERVRRCPGCGSWRCERVLCDVCRMLGACQLCGLRVPKLGELLCDGCKAVTQ